MNEIIELNNIIIDRQYYNKIESFNCENESVNNFLKNDALIMQENSMAVTKLFFDEKDNLVGFITLFNDIFKRISKQKLVKEKWDLEVADFYPSIRLHYMGVNSPYQRKGIGYTMLMEVFSICVNIADQSGCTFLSLESFESSLTFYEKIGFRKIGRTDGFHNLLFKIDELN